MQTTAQFIDPTSIMFFKLVLAIVLGGIIGTERAILARQPAGTRTFGLVALGACLFVVIGNYVNIAFLGIADVQPTFIAAAIITGIGFLGGGLIIFRGESLHGITTAAGLWITAAIGMAADVNKRFAPRNTKYISKILASKALTVITDVDRISIVTCI